MSVALCTSTCKGKIFTCSGVEYAGGKSTPELFSQITNVVLLICRVLVWEQYPKQRGSCS